jgi:acetyl esterase/lipase
MLKYTLRLLTSFALLHSIAFTAYTQTSPVAKLFPAGTVTQANIPYANDTLKKHLLDIYLPSNASSSTPLIVWVHGGAWMLNDKYADMSYMGNTIKGFIEKGYALASIDYRYSTTAVFPAQIQDCNQALEFLYQHAAEYHFDKNRIALIGFSAGGHLASLMGLSANDHVAAFYPAGMKPHFKIRCVLDYYGPSELIALANNPDTAVNNSRNALSVLLGAMAVDRPDLARKASPVTYIDKNDPPFIIVQGEKDESVPNTQSKLLHAWLGLTGVKSQLIIVPNAPHYGVMFDTEDIRKEVFTFLEAHL